MKLPVPDRWADDQVISWDERVQMALLRVAGCKCWLPLTRDNEIAGRVRCKTCSATVIMTPYSEEDKLAHERSVHLGAKELASASSLLAAAGIGDCYGGCGCEA